MGKKNRQNQQHKKNSVIPTVVNGGIQKRSHANNANLKIIVPGYTPNPLQPNPYQIPGYPARLVPGGAGPSTASTGPSTAHPPPSQSVPQPPVSSKEYLPHPSSLPNFVLPLPPLPLLPNGQPLPKPLLPLPTPKPAPSTAPSVVILPSFNNSALAQIHSQYTYSTARRRPKKTPVTVQSHPKAFVSLGNESESQQTKNAQLKYAKLLASRSNRSSIGAPPAEVKPDPDAPVFNLFMNIAQRYRSVQKEPEAIEVVDTEEDDDNDEVEEVTADENAATAAASMASVVEANDAANVTTFGDMSMYTVDEVGEKTMPAVGDGEEKEGEILLSEEEEEEEEILCLGTQKSNHVMSETVILGDDDDEPCEVDVASSESNGLNTAFRETGKSMTESIIDLSLDDEDNGQKEKEKAVSGKELPDFIPLIDGKERKSGRGDEQSSAHPKQKGISAAALRRGNGRAQQNGPAASSSSWSGAPFVVYDTGSRAKRRNHNGNNMSAHALPVGASPATTARTIAASTNTYPAVPTPTRIPLPLGPNPPTPLSHLYSCPPGSSSLLPPPPSSAMGLIQSRGISTSAPQSQPVNFGVPPPSAHPTLAAVLQDETQGVVRDSLTISGIFNRRWEETWRTEAFSAPMKVDPSAAPFRICSYNVLCQKTISNTNYLYAHTRFQPNVLQWAHRWPLLQRDLRELNADVFGLQEIQDIHFEQFYEPFMKSLGYVCFYQRKSETLHSDGLGIFVRANRFKITSVQTVDFLIPGDNLLDRGNVAQILRVECQQTGATMIITNTHILFNEKRGDVKLGQIALLMANIHAIRHDDEPVICLGDWNLEPASDLYNYITCGSLDASSFVPRYGSGQLKEGRNFNVPPMRELPLATHLKTRMSRDGVLHESEDALRQSLQRSPPSLITHQIPLASTYAPYGERQVSTFHKDIANPDFIFYTTEGRGETESSRLRLIRRLAVPPEAGIRQHLEPWPNQCVPSDHIPLMAEFYLSK